MSESFSKLPRYPLTRYFLMTSLVTAVIVPCFFSQWAFVDLREKFSTKGGLRANAIRNNWQQRLRELQLTPSQRGHAKALSETEYNAIIKDTLSELDVDVAIAVFKGEKWPTFVKSVNQRFEVSPPLIDTAFKGTLASRIIKQRSHHERRDRRRRFGHHRPPWHHPSKSKTPRDMNPFEAFLRGPPSIDRDKETKKTKTSKTPEHLDEVFHETYLPMTNGKGGKVWAVLIVRQNMGRLIRLVHDAGREFAGYSLLGILALMLALFISIHRAERTLEDRGLALIEANQKLRDLSSDLERQVEQRTRELIQAKNLASIGKLSAGVAHEVCNPIASIASCAEGLLRTFSSAEAYDDEENRQELQDYLEIIRDESFRIKDLTRNLLDFSRRGQSRVRELVDLEALISATARLVQPRLTQENKTLTLDLEKGIQLYGDSTMLRQMILNVTLNAIDALDPEGQVSWQARGDEQEVILICDDEGTGFSENDLDHALEPFHTGKSVGEGTGLGLSIADSVARQHGGRLELSNRRDKIGARIRIIMSRGGNDEDDSDED